MWVKFHAAGRLEKRSSVSLATCPFNWTEAWFCKLLDDFSERLTQMEFNELVADFAARYNVEGLAAENRTVSLDIDGIVVTLVCGDSELLASVEIGEPPSEGKAVFADTLLEANLESEAFFAKSHETGRYLILRRLAFAGLDPATFDTALEALVNAAETWRKFLTDFRPFAEDSNEKVDPHLFSSNGFLQV